MCGTTHVTTYLTTIAVKDFITETTAVTVSYSFCRGAAG